MEGTMWDVVEVYYTILSRKYGSGLKKKKSLRLVQAPTFIELGGS